MKTTPGMNTCSPILIVLQPVISSGVVSGVNWMRLNFAPSTCAIARPSSVFALPGRALDQDVALRERCDEQQVDGMPLADDDLADLVPRAVAQVDEVLVWTCLHVRHLPLLDRSPTRTILAVSAKCLPSGAV